jgi:hypothetical protein
MACIARQRAHEPPRINDSDYAEAQQLGHRWSRVACRDAALALKDFRDALSYIMRAAKECRRLCSPALLKAIEAAQRSFDLAIPDALGSRHIAAHSSEQIGTHTIASGTHYRVCPS